MLKRFKGLLIFGVVLLIAGSALAFAADQVPTRATRVPHRGQMFEILEKYPEVLEELRALNTEDSTWETDLSWTENRPGWGFQRGRHQRMGMGGRMGFCHGPNTRWSR